MFGRSLAGRSFECTLNEIEPILRNELNRRLAPEEKVLFCSCTEWNMVWVHLVTARQVIIAKAIYLRSSMIPFGKPKIESPKTFSAQLDDITEVMQAKSKEYDLFTVCITPKSGEALEACFVSKTEAQRFFNALQSARSNSCGSAPAQPASIDRMRELTRMHTEGLISDSEFEEKRQQILKDL